MRTKTLILTAALGLAGVATSMAQSNVYSLNIVGYVNLTAPPGFSMIANQLNTTNNTLGSLLPSVPPNTKIFKFIPGTGYRIYTFDEFDLAWTPNANETLNPGEGVFIQVPGSTNITLTFVGEVMTGSTTNPLPAGFSMKSSIIPQAGTALQLGIPGGANDKIFKFVPGTGYRIFTFDEFDLVWTPSVPSVGVGEAFWYQAAALRSWNRTFTVN